MIGSCAALEPAWLPRPAACTCRNVLQRSGPSRPCASLPAPPDRCCCLATCLSCRRAEDLQRSGQYQHVCLLMTEKDYARQTDLFDAVFT